MRILFVNPYYKPYLGGIERIIDRLAGELLQRTEVDAVGVFTTRTAFPRTVMSGLPPHEVIDGVDIFRARFRPHSFPLFFHASHAGYLTSDARRIMQTFKPDVVHFMYSEWWAANVQIYMQSRGCGHVLSTFFHERTLTPRTAALFLANRWLVKHVSRVHVLTDVEGKQVQHAYGAAANSITVIAPGVEIPARAACRDEKGDVNVLAVGRLSAHKGQLSLVQMCERLVRGEGCGVQLWLVGDFADAEQQIRKYVLDRRLDDFVHIVGRCSEDELQQHYANADVFALPSRYESFGLVFYEAMAQATPVITYATGPVPSILTRGSVLVPPFDADKFFHSLRELVLDTQLRKHLGAEARRLVDEVSGWGTVADQFLSLYSRIARSRAVS